MKSHCSSGVLPLHPCCCCCCCCYSVYYIDMCNNAVAFILFNSNFKEHVFLLFFRNMTQSTIIDTKHKHTFIIGKRTVRYTKVTHKYAHTNTLRRAGITTKNKKMQSIKQCQIFSYVQCMWLLCNYRDVSDWINWITEIQHKWCLLVIVVVYACINCYVFPVIFFATQIGHCITTVIGVKCTIKNMCIVFSASVLLQVYYLFLWWNRIAW